jgi:uncharacterized protein (DUF302 family)
VELVTSVGVTERSKPKKKPTGTSSREGLMENTAAKHAINKTRYGFESEVSLAFNEAVERTREVLKGEGFGVLSEVRMDEKFNEKLGVDFRKYVILGACIPPLAYKTVQEDINIGLLLPCNVVVYETDDLTRSVVAAIDAKEMMSVVGESPVIIEVADEVNEKLQRAIGQV